jgi:hypothetical protein
MLYILLLIMQRCRDVKKNIVENVSKSIENIIIRKYFKYRKISLCSNNV